MVSSIKRIYIGTIVNRDLDVFEEIRKFLHKFYNIVCIDLIKKGSNHFDERYFEKKLRKYPISLLIVKLTTHPQNHIIYQSIAKHAPQIPLLNSLNSIQTCENRTETFRIIQTSNKNLLVPRSYFNLSEAKLALQSGIELIIKLNQHNIPNFPKDKRIIGIVKDENHLMELVKQHKNESLFFQEFLGNHDIVYKVYVIGQWLVSITSHNRLNVNLTHLDLIHIRVPIEKNFKRRLIRVGRKLGMTIYGIDYVQTEKGPYIVDINDFPSFKSIPESISLIADHIYNMLSTEETYADLKVKIKS